MYAHEIHYVIFKEMQTAWQEAQEAWMQQVQDHNQQMYEAQQAHQFAYMTVSCGPSYVLANKFHCPSLSFMMHDI